MSDDDHIQRAKRDLWMAFATWSTVIFFLLMIAAFVGLFLKT